MNTKYLVVVAIIVISAGMLIPSLFRQDEQQTVVNSSNTAATITAVAPTPTVPATTQITQDWRGYENKDFKFGLLYPQDLNVKEYKESDGAMSVIFEERTEEGRGFQIYVTPYGEDHITQERFLLDVSSGVMEEPVDIMIGGVPATMFFSENSIMGNTREVWFINNGYLYEVVTYKQLDDWISTIMRSWKFI